MMEGASQIYGLQPRTVHNQFSDQNGNLGDQSMFSSPTYVDCQTPLADTKKEEIKHHGRNHESVHSKIMRHRWQKKIDKFLPQIDLNDLEAETNPLVNEQRQTAAEFSQSIYLRALMADSAIGDYV